MSVTEFGDHDALVKALQEITEKADNDEGYLTCEEISELTGMSRSNLQVKLKKLHRSGKLEVKNVQRSNISGYPIRIPGYRLISSVE